MPSSLRDMVFMHNSTNCPECQPQRLIRLMSLSMRRRTLGSANIPSPAIKGTLQILVGKVMPVVFCDLLASPSPRPSRHAGYDYFLRRITTSFRGLSMLHTNASMGRRDQPFLDGSVKYAADDE